jgi:hypothetical protein
MTNYGGRAPREKDVKRGVVKFLRDIGCHVYNLDQGYRPGGRRHATTRQTKGLPDLFAVWPRSPGGSLVFWIEVKRPGGRRSTEQVQFAARVMAAGGVVLCVWETADVVRFIERVRTAGFSPRAAALACLSDAETRGEKIEAAKQARGIAGILG